MKNYISQAEGQILEIMLDSPKGQNGYTPLPRLAIIIELEKNRHVVKLDQKTTQLFMKTYSPELSRWLGKTVEYSAWLDDKTGNRKVSVFPIR